MRLTHIGGPTVLIEAGGWRMLIDSTFDLPGETYRFGGALALASLQGPRSLPLTGIVSM
jgi:hypothetical protein